MNDEHPMEESGRHLVYLAAERTLLSWVRTGVAVMALGFVIDRFGIVVRQTSADPEHSLLSGRLSFWAGTAIVTLGVLMTLAATVRYWRFSKRYHRTRSTDPRGGLLTGIGFAITIALAGLLIAIMLVTLAG